MHHISCTLFYALLVPYSSHSIAVPVLMFVQTLSQIFANPLSSAECVQTGVSATIIDRAISAIFKVFNAIAYETSRATQPFKNLKLAAIKLNLVWGFTSGMAQFVMMAMFVQGCWFGAVTERIPLICGLFYFFLFVVIGFCVLVSGCALSNSWCSCIWIDNCVVTFLFFL